MSSARIASTFLVAFVVTGGILSCKHASTIPSDGSVTDGSADDATGDDAGGADLVGNGGASYSRVACTQLDPSPGPLLDDVECGRLMISARAGYGTAILPVLRLTPHTLNKQKDPVIVLAGGPGQSAVALLRAFYTERPFSTLLTQRDVIALGFRGTDGAAPDLVCTESDGRDFSNRQVAGGTADSVYATCRDRLAGQTGALSQFGSRQNAADILAFVEAAGIPAWNAYAFSYGTRTGIELAALNPQGLRAIVLDSAVPAETPLISEGVLRGNEVLARVLADCMKAPSCASAFPNSSEKLTALLQRLAATPEHRRLPDGVDVTIDDSQVLAILQGALSSRAGAGQVPLLIDVLDADISQLDDLLQAIVAGNRSVAEGVYLSVTCGEVPAGNVDPATLADPFLSALAKASYTTDAVKRLCGIWGVPYVAGAPAAASSIPTLILTGELDPTIRPEWAERVATGRDAAQAFTIPGESHTPGDSLCGSRVVQTFMEAPTQQVVQPCITEPRPLRFETP